MSEYAPIIKELPSVNLDFSEVAKVNAEKGAITALNHLATKLGVQTTIEADSKRASVKLGTHRGDVSVVFETMPGATHSSTAITGGNTIEDAATKYLKAQFLETDYPLYSIKVTKTDSEAIGAWFADPANKGKHQSPDFKTRTVFQIAAPSPALAA